MTDQKSSETIAAQALGTIDKETGALVPPIHVTSTYERDGDLGYARGLVYGRPDNPTIHHAEAVITALEKGRATLLFPSGMAAAVTLFLALERPCHIIAPRVMYWGLRGWLEEDAGPNGLDVTFLEHMTPEAVEASIRPGQTRLVWIETPANPLWGISDIAALSACTKRHGVGLAVDSTAATPVLTQPIELGADVVMHSATKYLNGHSDVVAGSLTFADECDLLERARGVRAHYGSILGPFEAALLLRGMRTLFVRVRQQCASALQIAEAMAEHSGVAEVLYPGLPDFSDYELARQQMTGGFGGMFSLRINGGEQAAIRTAARLQIWKRATSLGGVESLVEHRASIEGQGSPCPPDLLRFSTGLETSSDLITDLEQALSGNH